MSFLTPIFFLLGLLALPIIVLYMLRLRRQEILVSSTMLWKKLLRDREANAPWQRLRRNLLLFLQLLILGALVLALARPYLPVRSIISGSVVVLLDGSASMLATDVEPNRFAAAKEQVSDLIGDLGRGDQMTLILVGREPTVLASATSDNTALRRALEGAEAGPTSADWPAAIALASGAAQGFQEARIVVVSDGGLPQELPPLPAEAFYVPVGESGENLAISALATRDTESGPQLFASITNHGRIAQEALFSVNLEDTLFDSRRINVPPGGNSNLTWDLPGGAGKIVARLSDMNEDAFILDDVAWTTHEGGQDNRTLIVTEGNRFLETVLGVLPGLEVFRASPEQDLTAADAEPYDLYVFDGVQLPDPLPASDMLIINPQPGPNDLTIDAGVPIGVSGFFSNTNVVRVADSPLLQFVDWSNVHVRQAQEVDAAWAQPLVTAEGGPLLLTGEREGHRIAILTFSLQESDLPLQIAFPVLMANIMGWLSPGRVLDTTTGLHPGDPVEITPGAGTTAVTVLKPDNSEWTEEVGTETLLFAETGQLGLYEVSVRDAGGDRPAGSFAVNLFDSSESAIQPAEAVRFGQTTLEIVTEEDVGQRELWPWLAVIAFIILIGEWWAYHRGLRLPRLPNRPAILDRFGRH